MIVRSRLFLSVAAIAFAFAFALLCRRPPTI